MFEVRSKLINLQLVESFLLKNNSTYLGNYAFTDEIYSKKGEKPDFNREYLRLRCISINNRDTKSLLIVHKKTIWTKSSKKSVTLFKKGFDSKKEALKFLKHKYPNYKKILEIKRTGEEFKLPKLRIFIEDIDNYGLSIEIEAKDEKTMKETLKELGIKETISDSVPEMFRKQHLYK